MVLPIHAGCIQTLLGACKLAVMHWPTAPILLSHIADDAIWCMLKFYGRHSLQLLLVLAGRMTHTTASIPSRITAHVQARPRARKILTRSWAWGR